MSLFFDALGSFAGGLRDGVLAGRLFGGDNGRPAPSIDSLCEGNGWEPDERFGDGGYCLHFRKQPPSDRVYKVHIDASGRLFVLFVAYSACIPIPQLTPELFAYLARRNGQLTFAKWHAQAAGDDRVGFQLAYTALAHGLNPIVFKFLVEQMATELADFEDKLQNGLLNY